MRSPTTPGFSPSPACPTRRTPPSWRASTWRSWARRPTTSSPTGPGTRFGPRAIRAACCPPGPHLEAGIDGFVGAAGRRLRRRRRCCRPTRAHARGDRGARRPGGRRRRAADRARRRPLDRRAGHPRDRLAGSGPVGLIHFDTHTDTGAGGLRRRALTRLDHVPAGRAGPRRPVALRPDRAARLLAGGEGVRLAARARHHVAVHARRARLRHPLGGRAGAGAGGRGPGVPDASTSTCSTRRSRPDGHARAGRDDQRRPAVGVPRDLLARRPGRDGRRRGRADGVGSADITALVAERIVREVITAICVRRASAVVALTLP